MSGLGKYDSGVFSPGTRVQITGYANKFADNEWFGVVSDRTPKANPFGGDRGVYVEVENGPYAGRVVLYSLAEIEVA